MRPSQRVALAVCRVMTCALLACSSRALASDDTTVHEAVDRGVAYLLAEIRRENPPVWTTDGRNRGLGQVALETYALVVSGVAVDHPSVRGNLALLEGAMRGSRYTYGLACYVFALDAIIGQLESDELLAATRKQREKILKSRRIGRAFRVPLARAVTQLVELQRDDGGWGYGPNDAPEFDNSNVQFAALALGVGVKHRVPIERRVWLRVLDHFVRGQQRSGRLVKERVRLRRPSRTTFALETEVRARGWDYRNRGRANWSMTNAGLSSLILVRRNVGPTLRPERLAALDAAIRDGYGWVTTRWAPLRSLYGAYSLEKVADLGDVELFGEHDWYRELCTGLLATQEKSGGWPGGSGHGDTPRVATSFALLILNRASANLTRDSGAHIVISGRSGTENERGWVYVESIDATVHVSTLFRQIRLRPRPGFFQLLERVVERYPPERRGDLVPRLLKLHESCRSAKTRRTITDCLAAITGRRHREIEAFRTWHARWKRAVEIGNEASTADAPELIKLHGDALESPALRERVLWAIGRCRARAATPLLLEDLAHADERIRRTAYGALRSLFTDWPPAFDPAGKKSERNAQIDKIRRWCAEQTKNAS